MKQVVFYFIFLAGPGNTLPDDQTVGPKWSWIYEPPNAHVHVPSNAMAVPAVKKI
jgi:hypothetical protein